LSVCSLQHVYRLSLSLSLSLTVTAKASQPDIRITNKANAYRLS